jgi:hypothetical protein
MIPPRRKRLLPFVCMSIGALAAPLVLGAGGAAPAAAVPPDYMASSDLNIAATVALEGFTEALDGDETFAGVQIVPSGVQFSFVGKPSAAFTAKLATLPESLPRKLRKVTNSLASLNRVVKALDNDVKSLKADGVAMSSWGPDLESNNVKVALAGNVPDPTSKSSQAPVLAKASHLAQASKLTKAYGNKIKVSDKPGKVELTQDRFTDFSPFTGGSAIDRPGPLGGCTSWFNTISNASTNHYAFTAGHCGAGTFSVINGGTLGTTTTLKFGGNMDAQSIRIATGTSTVWTDPRAPGSRYVKTVGTVQVGTTVCTSGKTSREVCNVVVDGVNSSYPNVFNGVAISGLTIASQRGPIVKNAFQDGDSGGPVYALYTTDGVIAYGMITAKEFTAQIPGSSSCCYAGYFLPAVRIISSFNVHIRIGP